MRTFALSIHADYACAHSGACCTAGWAIPVEPAKRSLLGADVLIPSGEGVCRYYDSASHRCAVHRNHGEDALPDACRHFPRLALIDDRGVHITLSHFCPTAARCLLRDDVPLVVADAPPAFPAARDYEGLDARGEWPPLIHDALLFDLDGYDAWERFVVSAFAEGSSHRALARIATAAERLREWTPTGEPLAIAVGRIVQSHAIQADALNRYEALRSDAVGIVRRSIPEPLRTGLQLPPTAADRRVAPVIDDRVSCRYLAAKAFGTWTAYQARGIRTLVAELVIANALLQSIGRTEPTLEAIREADRLLVHLADRAALLEAIDVVEHDRRPGDQSRPLLQHGTDDANHAEPEI